MGFQRQTASERRARRLLVHAAVTAGRQFGRYQPGTADVVVTAVVYQLFGRRPPCLTLPAVPCLVARRSDERRPALPPGRAGVGNGGQLRPRRASNHGTRPLTPAATIHCLSVSASRRPTFILAFTFVPFSLSGSLPSYPSLTFSPFRMRCRRVSSTSVKRQLFSSACRRPSQIDSLV